jgi:transposase InsO family protein
MGQKVLTRTEREQIYVKKESGMSLQEIADELKISYECARKWWRRSRDAGLSGLEARKRGRKPKGMLSEFDERVVEKSLVLKRSHKRWGANRVLVELAKIPELAALKRPSRSRLQAYFRQTCPESVSIWTQHKQVPKPAKATAVHETWQLDHQEGHRLGNGEIATVCNIRDPYGAAMIASQAFSVKTEQRWRKLTWEEVRQVLRAGFAEWKTLPDSVMTDNEMSLGGNPNDPFPSWLSLWLAGLGIKHVFIRSHCPKDQAQIERQHRTLDGFTFSEEDRQTVEHFQKAFDRERHVYNHDFPSRASACNQQAPLTAFPALLQPRRPYSKELEPILFSMQRVFDYLATFTFDRKVNSNGQVTLKGIHYTVGLAYATKTISVSFDPQQQQWIFSTSTQDGQLQEVKRQALVGMTYSQLTGVEQVTPPISQPVQLTLPLAA